MKNIVKKIYEINSDIRILRSIAVCIWIIVSKNNFIGATPPVLSSTVVVWSGHATRPLPRLVTRPNIMASWKAKTRLSAVPSWETNQHYLVTASCLKIFVHIILPWEANQNYILSPIASNQRYFVASVLQTSENTIDEENCVIFQRFSRGHNNVPHLVVAFLDFAQCVLNTW